MILFFFLVVLDGSFVVEMFNFDILVFVIFELYYLQVIGLFLEDVVINIRGNFVFLGYEFYFFRINIDELFFDKLRLIVVIYIFRKRVEELKD